MENSQLTFVSPVGKMEGNEYLVRPKVALKGDLKISTNSTQNIKIRVFVDGTKTNGVIEKDLNIFQSATKTAPLSSGETYNPYREAKYTASSSGHHRIINIKDVNLAIINSGTCHKLKFHHYNLRVELYIGDNSVCSCRSNDFIAVFRDPKNPNRTNLNNNNINNNNINNNNINNNINNNFNNNTNSNTNTNSNNNSNNSNNDNDKIINNSNFNNISTFPTQHQQELLQVFQSLVEQNQNARIEMQIREQKMQDIISQLSQSSQSNSPASVPQNIQSDDDNNNNNNNNNNDDDDDDDDNDDDMNDNGSFVDELFQAHYQVNHLYTDSPSEVDEYQFTQNINKKFKYN